MESNKKSEEEFSLLTIFAAICALSIILCVIISVCSGSDDSNSTVNTAQTSSSSDINKLTNFHKQVVGATKQLEDAQNEYDLQTKEAKKNADIYAFYDAARALNEAAIKANSIQINVPDLTNQASNQDIKKTYKAFQAYNGAILEMSRDVMDSVNNDRLSPEELHNIKEARNASNVFAVQLAVGLLKSYADLGYNIDQVDIDNGGLLPAKSTNPKGELKNNQLNSNTKISAVKLPPIKINTNIYK